MSEGSKAAPTLAAARSEARAGAEGCGGAGGSAASKQ